MLEEYEYGSAMSVAVVLLVVSFLLLGLINLLEKWARRYQS
jgi:sulfate transport system permease protein